MSRWQASGPSRTSTSTSSSWSPTRASEAREIAHRHGATVVSDPRGACRPPSTPGITANKGEEFYAWLGDDDLLMPDGLATLSGLLDAAPTAVVAYGACPYIDDRGRTVAVSRAGDLAAKILAWGPDLVPQPASLTRVGALSQPGSTTSPCASRWTWTCSYVSSGWAGSSRPSRTSRPSAGMRTR